MKKILLLFIFLLSTNSFSQEDTSTWRVIPSITDWAKEVNNWQDSIYHSYNSFVGSAKALLIGEDIKCNTQIKILRDFDETFIKGGLMTIDEPSFEGLVTELNKVEPSIEFAAAYYAKAKTFIGKVKIAREEQISRGWF